MGIGLVLAALGVVALVINLIFFSLVYDLAPWEKDVTVPGGLFALSPSQIDQLSFFTAIPGALFLIAFCFICSARVLRDRLGTRETVGLEGGTVVSENTYLSPRAHLGWLGVALVFWIVLIPVPVLLAVRGGWPATVRELPQGHVWANLGIYGGITAAVAGTLLVSHFKKQHYLALVAAHDPRLDEPQRGIWRWATFRWRFDLWLGALGGALSGASLIALPYDGVVALAIPLALGTSLMVLGVLLGRQYWRSHMPLGLAESFA
ncbi:hypothetical protein [Arthrobacter agilis]|uniref:hypothetical protein n=1 Tax=Arthrobacter agilis TaxID=37921 RepID=UPI0027859A0F|nr:hypothetical protein [Arthrobacter agilis]MDQ0734728.1 hypothetical protein [Arthrobacter agilis]